MVEKTRKNIITKTVMIVLVILLLFALFFNGDITGQVDLIKNALFDRFYFMFFWTVNIVIICLVILCLTKYGKVKIGGKDSKIEYSNFSWYSMLFSAGMGIGLLFYGVAEPLSHFNQSEVYNVANPYYQGLASTYLSWGIHAWAIYVLFGLAFAFFAYNKGLPLSLRSLFYPILKDRIYGKIGDLIDAFGIIITLFALASSLGLGVMQINSGMHETFGLAMGPIIQIIIILLVIFVASISVISGIGKGIRILSETNIYLIIILAIILFIAGPTLLILSNIFGSAGTYFIGLPVESFTANNASKEWLGSWSVFYLAWWISWSVFVGIFIAKISKGRTVRNFIISILIVPTIASIFWFSIVGTNAIFVDIESGGVLTNLIDAQNGIPANLDGIPLSVFTMIDLTFSSQTFTFILQIVTTLIVILFFITSSDSGALVVTELAKTGGEVSNSSKLFWTYMQAIIAIVLLVLGGAVVLTLIQDILIILSLPVTFFMLYLVVVLFINIVKYFRSEINSNKE